MFANETEKLEWMLVQTLAKLYGVEDKDPRTIAGVIAQPWNVLAARYDHQCAGRVIDVKTISN